MAAATAQQTSGRRWVVLAVATFAQTAACAFVYGVPFLVPDLRDQFGLSLAAAGAYVAAPTAGLLATLILWGAAADRFGERRVMASGLLLAALAVGAVGLTPGLGHGLVLALFAVGGASAASVFAACGRMIMGWFARTERGLAMGIRQTAQPLGVAVAGLLLPGLASGRRFRRHGRARRALPARGAPGDRRAPDPARPPRVPGEHTGLALPHPGAVAGARGQRDARRAAVRGQRLRHRVPRAAAGLEHHGRGRVRRDDPDRGRGRPHRLRRVVGPGGLAAAPDAPARGRRRAGAARPSRSATRSRRGWRSPRSSSAAIVTVADNGLAFTAVAEIAGPMWSGRALGVQNTGQNIDRRRSPRSRSAPSSGRRATRSGSRWPPSRRWRRSASLRSVTSRKRPGSPPPALVRSAATGPHPTASQL